MIAQLYMFMAGLYFIIGSIITMILTKEMELNNEFREKLDLRDIILVSSVCVTWLPKLLIANLINRGRI